MNSFMRILHGDLVGYFFLGFWSFLSGMVTMSLISGWTSQHSPESVVSIFEVQLHPNTLAGIGALIMCVTAFVSAIRFNKNKRISKYEIIALFCIGVFVTVFIIGTFFNFID